MTTPTSDAAEMPLEAVVSKTFGRTVPESLSALVPALTSDLAEIDFVLDRSLTSTYPRLREAATYASRSGGKRVRPLLMAVAHRALGGTTPRPILALAASFQLIHTATLVHDDVIDHAEQRRGRPSVARAFGLPAAIVAGDYLFVRAFELAAEYPRSIILRCGEACADLAEGEILQETSRFDLTTGVERYYRVIEMKTAAIVSAALASVGEIAGMKPAIVDGLAQYGKAVGVAFQLRDDLLDMYGDPDLLGKPLFADLREGNPTLVTLEAYAHLTGGEKSEFERLFALHRKQPHDLLRLRELTDRTGAPERTAAAATAAADRAVKALSVLTPNPYVHLLELLARGAAERPF
ncbi:MAG: polyprenyl synthetase family protein [Thermoplasmata archaeon]|nr:polyprenyl synthetase family protein [Thermoplasmata archaeon]